jgi:hypothetical protein
MRYRLPHGLGGRRHWVAMLGGGKGRGKVKILAKTPLPEPRPAEQTPAGGSVAVSDWRKSSRVILNPRDTKVGCTPQTFPNTLSIFHTVARHWGGSGGDHGVGSRFI